LFGSCTTMLTPERTSPNKGLFFFSLVREELDSNWFYYCCKVFYWLRQAFTNGDLLLIFGPLFPFSTIYSSFDPSLWPTTELLLRALFISTLILSWLVNVFTRDILIYSSLLRSLRESISPVINYSLNILSY